MEHQELHTSERSIVPRTVIFIFVSSFSLNPKQFFSTLPGAGCEGGTQPGKLIYGCLQQLGQKQATAITDILPLHLF